MARLSECNRESRPATQLVLTVNLLIFLITLSSSFLTASCATRVIRQSDAESVIATSSNVTTPDTVTGGDVNSTAIPVSNITKQEAPEIPAESSTLGPVESASPGLNVTDAKPKITPPPETILPSTEKPNSTEITTGVIANKTSATLASSEVSDMAGTTTELAPTKTPNMTTVGSSSTSTTVTTLTNPDNSTTTPSYPKTTPAGGKAAGISFNIIFLIVPVALISF